ncbi:MAG: hypothetical protein HKO07_04375, partial [Pseudomonadales bacterium]|nr:hypothetical protein [Pseudomonadales bacterium]
EYTQAANAAELQVPGEAVARALHTLVGGSRIAKIQPIADITAPAEALVNHAQRENAINTNQRRLLQRAAQWLEAFLAGEPDSAQATLALVDEFNIALSSALSERPETDNAERNSLLALSGLILDGRQFLRSWRAQTGVPAQYDTLVAELRSIADAASGVPEVEPLVEAMLALYRCSAEIGLHYHSYNALLQAHLDLENMLDRIAAGQQPEAVSTTEHMRELVTQDEALIQRLADSNRDETEEQSDAEQDALDEEIVAIFLEESQDLIEEVEASVVKWLSDQKELSYLESLLRPLHTIKGGARMAGLEEVGNLCHEFESLLESASNQDVKINAGFFKKISNYLADL